LSHLLRAALVDGLLLQVVPVTLVALHLLRAVAAMVIKIRRRATISPVTTAKTTATSVVRISMATLLLLATIISKDITTHHVVAVIIVGTPEAITITEVAINLRAVAGTTPDVAMAMIDISFVSMHAKTYNCVMYLDDGEVPVHLA
jgi:hypothetical protein